MGTDIDLASTVEPNYPAQAPPAAGEAVDLSQLETFFAVSLDLLVIRDENYNILKVNPAWERTLGWSAEELEGQPMLSFIHPDDVAPSHSTMRRIESEAEVRQFINRYRCRDGSYRHLEWRARQVGRLVYGVARDVTERLALEAGMARAKAEAEAANQAKNDFFANMSHEVRTPLNGVIGVAAALARTELSDAQGQMVELILTSGATLERVVSDVLDFSKIEAGRLEIEIAPFDLRLELEGLLGIFKPRADQKGLAFEVELGPRVRGEHLGDSVRIKQVLGNLVSNAIKFTERGVVRITADVTDAGNEAASELVFEVQDSGIGFDEAFARNLFQRFSQADGSITRRFGGTGLGLSICRALVEMMGGEIDAASTPGQGSRFRVRLPLRPSEPHVGRGQAGAVDDLEACAAALGPLQVLVAEDHEINRRVIELILAPIGAGLTMTEDGAQAVSAFGQQRFDLVLMDMQMPIMDGLAATRAIRAGERKAPGRPRTPIIMLSANAMRQHTEEAKAAGADLHLAKPVTPERLLRAVAEILGAGAEKAA